MKQISEDCGIATRLSNVVPALKPETASPAETLALHLATENETGAVSYATEAGLFQEAGLPAIICGPGSIEQAHKPDEYVAASELAACEEFMRRLARYCSA
jgi:acetylornithine deacetylase